MNLETNPLIRTVFAAAILIGSGRAQAPAKPAQLPPLSGDATQAHQEMERLFGQVELRLRKVDHLLSDAGAGDVQSLKQAGTSGLDELLKQSHAEARATVDDIDRILELSNHQHRGGT